MKVTKYPQSCLVLEKNGKRIVIDPGNFVAQAHAPSDLLPVQAILITHEHADHADSGLITALSSGTVPVYGNSGVKGTLGDLVTQVIGDGDVFEVAGFRVRAFDLLHVDMADGSPGPLNTGFVIDDVFFHPGDGIDVNGLTVPAAAVPIGGPDISPRDVFDFIKATGAKTIIPMHYDYFVADPDFIAMHGQAIVPGVHILHLADGQSTEIA